MTDNTSLNGTCRTIISRLPNKPLLSPREIADALGHATTQSICTAIECGELPAVTIGRRHIIDRDEAVQWIERSAT